MSSSDQYTAKADATNKVTPQEKINDLNSILNQTKYGMRKSQENITHYSS